MKTQNLPDLSIVISTYNSEKTVVDCLASLDCQKTGKAYEIIVVDSSDDQTQTIIKNQFPLVKLYHFSERKYCGDARNVGVVNSKAPIIAFMDSDCTVDENWVDQVVNAHGGVNDVVGGVILNGASQTIPGWAYYFCEFNLWLPTDKCREIPEIAGCALSIKRQIFDNYGPFIEGTYCSDTALHWRMWEDGIKVLFVPSIKVYHTANYTAFSLLHHFFSHRSQFTRLMVHNKRLSNLKKLIYCFFIPVLPIILFGVVFLRVLKSGVFIKELFYSSPLVFAGLTARALGEYVGLLQSRSSRERIRPTRQVYG